jgi:hypothetical protein
MRTLFAVAAFLCASTGAFAESSGDKPAKAENSVCICGKVVDAKSTTVTVNANGKQVAYRVCSKECGDAVKKMKPEDTRKAIEGHKRDKSDGE